MGRIITYRGARKKTGLSDEKELNTLDKLLMFGFFVYLSVYLGNKQGTGTIDAIILRLGFALFVGVFILKWLLDTMSTNYKYGDVVTSNRNKFYLGIFLWFLVFTMFCFISYFWATNEQLVMAQKNSFICILILCLILPYAAKSKEILSYYLEIFVLANLYAVISLIIKLPISEWEVRIGRAIGWHSNDFGIHLACACIIAIYLINSIKTKRRILYAVLFVVFTVIMFFTGSRQAIIMLVIGVIVYSTLTSKNIFRIFKNWILAIALIAVLYILFTRIEILYEFIGYRFEGLFNYFTGEGEADSSTLEREFFMNTAVDMFVEKPIQGYGLANFAQRLREMGYSKVTWCHNNYLELLTSVGIIGTAIFYSFLVSITFKIAIPAFKKDKLAIILFALMIMYFFDDYVAVNYFYIYNHCIYIFVYTYILMYERELKDQVKKWKKNL